jgi:hypothetical protein
MNALGQYRFAVHGVIMGKRPQPWLDIETALASLVSAHPEIGQLAYFWMDTS